VQIAVLGPLEVHDDAGRPVDVAGTRLRTLLTRLALDAGRPVAVSVLVDAVWGDDPPAEETNALQTLVSRLRRAIGDTGAVVQSPAGYRLAADPSDVDANRFERLAGEGAAALRRGAHREAGRRLAEALALWRGPALADTPADALAVYATRLEDLRLATVLDRIDADLDLTDPTALVPELEALAAEHPLHERLTGQLMRALGATGRQADALLAYERLRARLADELGVDPSAELQEIHLGLLRGELGTRASTSRRTNLKAQLTSFVGRDDEVARIGKSLEQNRLVTLVGPGGAGKTRLAAEAAALIVDTAADGIWLVELASVTDGADVPQTVLGSLGLREAHLLDRRTRLSARDATSRLLDALSGRRSIIVLDNCEHLIEASARLSDLLLAECPQLRVLATSREPLGIFGETLLVVPPLGQPAAEACAAEALEYPAVRLFVDRATAVRPDFVVDDRSVGTVVEIVRRLDGLPLAIELAAARLRTMPLGDIADRLSDRFRLLTGGSRTALPRHRTLRAVVEWSWELLSPAERLLAERLAVFPAGATSVSAAAVCSDASVVPLDVPDLLSALVDKSLLQPVADGGRLRMLETIREYGVERLAERHELAGLRRRHAAYFVELVREAAAHLRDAGQLPWMRLLEAERDNVLGALRFLADDAQSQQVLELAAGVGWYWMFTGAYADAATWLSFALEAPGDADPDLRLLVGSMAAIASASGALSPDAEQVETGLQRLGDMSARFDHADTDKYPMLLLMRPVISMFSADTDGVDRTLAAAMSSDDRWIAAAALMFRANVAENVGDTATMRHSVAQALDEFRELGERWGLATCLQIVGMLNTQDGDLDTAAANYQEALRLVGELGAHDDSAWLNLRLADVYLRRGDFAAATDLVRRAQEISAESGSLREEVFSRVVLADVMRQTGEVAAARRLRDEALERLTAMPAAHPVQSHGIAVTLAIVAKHHVLDDEMDEARESLARGFAAAVGTRDMPIVASVGVVAALIADRDGDAVGAAQRLGAAARLRGTDDPTQPDIATLTARLRDELGADRFAEAYAWGKSLDRDAAIARLEPSAWPAGADRPG
jgi:predicted ATPase